MRPSTHADRLLRGPLHSPGSGTQTEGRAQPRFGDFASALEAIAVITFLNATKCGVDLHQRLRFQLDQREPDIVLDVYLGALGSVEPISVTGSVASDVANSSLNFLRKLAAPTFENRPEVIKSACLCYSRLNSLEH
jgi:hypothetical protein